MNLSEIHLKRVAREILLRVLQQGIIPSGEALYELTKKRTDGMRLDQPEFSQKDHLIQYGESASASKFNMLSSRIAGDMDVLYNALLEAEQTFAETNEKTMLELQRLSRKTKSLISRANRLLLTTEKTGGLLNVLGDDFTDSSLIDQTRTTAFVDLEGQTVHGKYFRSSEVNLLDSLDLSELTANDIKVTPLSRTLRRAPGTRDSSVLDMFSDREQPWIYTVSTELSEDAAIEVKIDFRKAIIPPEEWLSTYKITIDPFITNNSLLILTQHSDDGITWKDLPVSDPSRRVSAPTSYFVGDLRFRFLRIIMSRDTHTRLAQSGERFHDFGIRRIIVHGVKNIFEPESVLYSKNLLVLDESGNRKKFTKAAISLACEHIEPETDIEYFVSFLDSNLAEGAYQKIVPLSRESITGAQIAEVSNATIANKTQTIDTVTTAFPGNTNANLFLLTGEVGSGKVSVWRNVGNKRELYSVRQPDRKIVEAGWTYEEGFYSTYILINENGGKEFDFGPSSIEIDGVSLNGKVRLSEGVHFVRVQEANWQSLNGLNKVRSFNEVTKEFVGERSYYGDEGFTRSISDGPLVEENYHVIDHLYPYNHKVLIEGLQYSSRFAETSVKQKYSGVSRYAAYFMTKLSDIDLDKNTSNQDYSKYSIVGSVLDDVPASRVMIKFNKLANENPREQFIVSEETSNSHAEGLIFKAVFKTTNPRRSPSLDGYEIKISE